MDPSTSELIRQSPSASSSQIRVPRQGWAELTPPDPEIKPEPASRSTLMSPSSGEGSSSSPIETFDKTETRSLDELLQKSSRRTDGQSGHVSQQARQRIREKTKSMVEKQRRLAKKMAQSQRSVESSEGESGGNDGGGGGQQQEEIAQGDVQIEQSIQLGAKYVDAAQLRWEDPELEGQTGIRPDQQHMMAAPFLLLTPPRSHGCQNAAKFRKMLVWKGADPVGRERQEDIERGGGRNVPHQEGEAKLVTQDVEKPSHGPPFGLLLLPATGQLVWHDPLPWTDWLQQSGTRRWASQRPTALWLDLQGIEFDHHWLFTRAEAAQRALLAAFDCWAEVHQQMLGAVKEWLALRQRMSEQEDGKKKREEEEERKEEEENGGGNVLDALFRTILRHQSELDRCGAALERAWAGTDQARGRFLLERLEGHAEVFEEESEGGVPEQFKAFFHSPLYMLSERAEQQQEGEGGRMPSTVPMPPLSELEKQRRAGVANCRYQIQVFFNELLVGSSDECALEWPNFAISFAQIFPLRVFERPEQVTLALRERFGRGGWQPISDIFVPLPNDEEEEVEEESGRKLSMAPSGLQFASAVSRGSYKGSLGCGQDGLPFIQGRLFCSLQWQNAGKREAKLEQKRRAKARSEQRRQRSSSRPSLFPAGTLLCPEEAIQTDHRLMALERRWQGMREKGGGGGGRRIGLEGHQREEAGGMEGRRGREGGDWERAMAGRGELELEMGRRMGREFAMALREYLRESGEQQRRVRDLAQLVREDPPPQFGTGLGLLSSLLANRQLDISRQLKPVRNPAAPFRPLFDSAIRPPPRLVLNIQHAIGVPLRANGQPAHIFLLCTLQGHSQPTALVDGRHANWQETLVMDVPPPANGQEQEGGLFLEVEMFDREVHPIDHDDREKDTRHERVERRWLGSAQIPLGALQAMAKMDGHLALDGPMFYTGYKLPIECPTTIRLLITPDPPPPILASPPIPSTNSSSFGESDANLIAECLKFYARLHRRFPARRILPLAIDSTGKRVLACRFLRRLAPPPSVVDLFSDHPKRAVNLAATIAASIPLLHDDGRPLAGEGGGPVPIWSSADQVVRILSASPDEQAILLCCWLLGLQLSAVLLLGTALPNGPNCAFVLVQFADAAGQHWLINPANGHHFAPSDSNCPLLSVGTILTMDNVFANVQPVDHPSQLDFDLRKRGHWEALFADGGRRNLVSVQPESLRYEPVDENALMELRTGLEREIRLKFDEQRPFAIPQWNLLASRSLRELLANFWRDLSTSSSSAPSDSTTTDGLLDSRLAHLRPAFHLSALAFRLPFISRAQIIRHTLRTLVHTNSQPHAQFALAVHLQPFFGALISCSVAICTLVPNGTIAPSRN